MLRFLGRHASLLAFGVLGAVVLAPLAVLLPLFGALALALVGTVAALAAHIRATRLKDRCEVLSREVGALSARLLRAEGAAAPDAGRAALAGDVDELTVEIGLLSGIVRDLTTVVMTQDGEVAKLKTELAAVAARPMPEAAPAPAQVPAALPPTAPTPFAELPRLPAVAAQPAAPRPPPLFPGAVSPAERPSPEPSLAPPVAEPQEPSDETVLAAFEASGLEVHLQPVVTLPQRKVVAYEALARLRVGRALLEPAAFRPALERNGRTTELDRRMLQRAATVARHLSGRGSAASVSYGLSPLSLFEPGFLRWLARLVADEPLLAGGRLVLALSQASWRGLDREQTAALAALRGRIGLALDRPEDLRFDPAALAAGGIDHVKVPAALLLRPAPGRHGLSDIAVEDLAAALARTGVRLVATAVAAEADVPDLIDLDVPMAQGAVFASPRPVRAEILTEATAPTPEPPEPDPPERRPFRSFLRRAG